MPAVPLRSDWDAVRVRDAARSADGAAQARRLLAIAAVYDGMSRASAATVGIRFLLERNQKSRHR